MAPGVSPSPDDAPWLAAQMLDRLEGMLAARAIFGRLRLMVKLAGVIPLYLDEDPIERHRFLFDKQVPELPLRCKWQNHNKQYEIIEETRQKALAEIWAAGRFADLERLAAAAKLSWLVATCPTRQSFSVAIEEGVLSWLDRGNIKIALCAEA